MYFSTDHRKHLPTVINTSRSGSIFHTHGVQRRMISVVNFFRFFEIIMFCFVVAMCNLVHAVDAMYGLP